MTAAGIRYLDGHRIRRGLRAGALRVISAQEHLNKINVYPVPDGDTGTNLALTMSSVYSAMTSRRHESAGETLTLVADAALDGARGNSGAIVAQFFHGLSDSVSNMARLTARQFATAVTNGERYARDALVKPVEGTVLTVMRDFAQSLEQRAADQPGTDFVQLLRAGLNSARASLAATPDKLDALRHAGVVDAGAEGFVRLVDGICDYIATGKMDEAPATDDLVADEETLVGEAVDLEYRYCTECMITGADIDRRALKESLMSLGGSLVLAGTHQKTRVHIHVNDPQRVFELAATYGSVSANKADDMHRQQARHHDTAQHCAVAMDSAGDIPDAELERLGVHMTPVRLHFGTESYLDKVSITADNFYARIASGETAKTSQPPPGDFRRDFQYLASHYEEVICITISGAASGTFQSATSAAERSGAADRVHVFDSWSVSVGQGLLALHAAEQARSNTPAKDILSSLQTLRTATPIFALVRDLDAAVRGGRVSGVLKRIVDSLRLTPVLGIKGEGRLAAIGMLAGRRRALEKYTRFILRRADPTRRYRLAVGHTNCEEEARGVYEALVDGIDQLDTHYFCRIGSALGAHTGADGIVVALQDRSAIDN